MQRELLSGICICTYVHLFVYMFVCIFVFICIYVCSCETVKL